MPVEFQDERKRKIYVVIRDASLAYQTDKPLQGYVPFGDKGKYIRKLSYLEGYITKIEWYTTEWQGKKLHGWNLTVDDGVDNFQLDIPFNSNEASRFMKISGNIDYEKPVKISVWRDRVKQKSAMSIKQDDVNVPEKFKHNQYETVTENGQKVRKLIHEGNLPDPTETPTGLDWRDSEIILFKFVRDKVIPHIAKLNVAEQIHQTNVPNVPAGAVVAQQQQEQTVHGTEVTQTVNQPPANDFDFVDNTPVGVPGLQSQGFKSEPPDFPPSSQFNDSEIPWEID